MLIELCAGNYTMFDGLVIGADVFFKTSTTCLDRSIIWIISSNTMARTFTKEKFDEIGNDKTSIERLIKEIRVGIIQSHLIIRIKFLVSVVVARIINCFPRSSSHKLAFDPTNVKKHGLTPTVLL